MKPNHPDDFSAYFEAELATRLRPAIASIEAMMVKFTDSVILDLPSAAQIRFLAAIMIFQGLSDIEKLAGFRPGEEM